MATKSTRSAAPKKAAPKKTAPKKAAAPKKARSNKKGKVYVPKETGLENALKMRHNQFFKEGVTVEGDDSQAIGQLRQYAIYALTQQEKDYPKNIDGAFRDRVEQLAHVERMDLAITLLGRERARLNRVDAAERRAEAAAKRPAKKSAARKR